MTRSQSTCFSAAGPDLMIWNWVEVILAFIALIILPRFVIEWAWSRRVRAKMQAGGSERMSFVQHLQARSIPWLVFGGVGLLCAFAALLIVVLTH
jgi:hypothetical protein